MNVRLSINSLLKLNCIIIRTLNVKQRRCIRYGQTIYHHELTWRSYSSQLLDGSSEKKKRTKKESCFITDEALAADIVSELGVNLQQPDSTVIELSPGYGILTKALLDAGAPRVVAFEPELKYHQHLEILMADLNDGRLKYFGQDLMRLPRYHVFDTVSSGAESEYFPELNDGLAIYRCIQKEALWEEEPLVRVIGVTASNRQKEQSYFRTLQYSLSLGESIFSVSRPDFFYFVSAEEYDVMSMPFPPPNLTKYRPPVVFYKLFFDITLLDKIPRSCFTPRLQVRNKTRAGAVHDPSYLYFVHLTPKKSLYQDVCSKENFPEFIFFIQQLLHKRKWRLIPRMELWAPGYGLELIKMGFTMMQYTGEISPEDWRHLFQAFQKTVHFKESSFRSAFEEYHRGSHSEVSVRKGH